MIVGEPERLAARIEKAPRSSAERGAFLWAVGASLLAMDVNDDVHQQDKRGALEIREQARSHSQGTAASGGEARAFSTAAMNSGSSGLVRLEKLAITLPWRSTTYL